VRRYNEAKCRKCIHFRVCWAWKEMDAFVEKHHHLLINETSTGDNPQQELRDLLAYWCYLFEESQDEN
jgi:hypothetical protein